VEPLNADAALSAAKATTIAAIGTAATIAALLSFLRDGCGIDYLLVVIR